MNSEKAHDFQIPFKRIKGQDARHRKDNSMQHTKQYRIIYLGLIMMFENLCSLVLY